MYVLAQREATRRQKESFNATLGASKTPRDSERPSQRCRDSAGGGEEGGGGGRGPTVAPRLARQYHLPTLHSPCCFTHVLITYPLERTPEDGLLLWTGEGTWELLHQIPPGLVQTISFISRTMSRVVSAPYPVFDSNEIALRNKSRNDVHSTEPIFLAD